MVRTGTEAEFKKQAQQVLADHGITASLYFFQRRLKKGKRDFFDAPLFPGYLFLQVEKLTAENLALVKKVKNFCRLLPSTTTPQLIRGKALQELELFMGHGEYLGVSQVVFLPGKKIKAISGPMVGLEGNVYKINKKKKQITVISSLSPDGKKFDLLYQDAELVEE
jgi:transcriptional antiterminator NusG